MRGREPALYAVFAALLQLGFAAPTYAQTTTPTPYASLSAEVERYAGPGRASTNDLTGQVVRIGLLAPLQGPRKAEGDAMVAAAQMALRDNASRSLLRGRRIELAVEDSGVPSWGTVSDAVIRLMLTDEAVAVIASTSRADTHLCEQVGNRIGVPVLTLSADPTTTQIDIPWIFRMGPSDAQQAQQVAQDIPTVARKSFASRFQQSTGIAPIQVASETYDAVTLTVLALQTAGPNRARVRDQIARTINYDGVSGRISFDREGNDAPAPHWVHPK
jgi:ABC-type branched-subunit amino acid transport system substrate-binding protein